MEGGRCDPGKMERGSRWSQSIFCCCCFCVTKLCLTLCNPWTTAYQDSSTLSRSLIRFMSIASVMPSNHLILCCLLFVLPSVLPSIRLFSGELALHIRWPKYWTSASVLPMNNQGWFPLGLTGGSLCSPWDSQESSPAPVRKHQFFSAQPPLWSYSHICTWLL